MKSGIRKVEPKGPSLVHRIWTMQNTKYKIKPKEIPSPSLSIMVKTPGKSQNPKGCGSNCPSVPESCWWSCLTGAGSTKHISGQLLKRNSSQSENPIRHIHKNIPTGCTPLPTCIVPLATTLKGRIFYV